MLMTHAVFLKHLYFIISLLTNAHKQLLILLEKINELKSTKGTLLIFFLVQE